MARIFLSHSSANDVDAVALSDWLTTEGWDDLGIAAGPGKVQIFVRQPGFDELAKETEGRLSDPCKPRRAGTYDTAPCWPDWLRSH